MCYIWVTAHVFMFLLMLTFSVSEAFFLQDIQSNSHASLFSFYLHASSQFIIFISSSEKQPLFMQIHPIQYLLLLLFDTL